MVVLMFIEKLGINVNGIEEIKCIKNNYYSIKKINFLELGLEYICLDVLILNI